MSYKSVTWLKQNIESNSTQYNYAKIVNKIKSVNEQWTEEAAKRLTQ